MWGRHASLVLSLLQVQVWTTVCLENCLCTLLHVCPTQSCCLSCSTTGQIAPSETRRARSHWIWHLLTAWQRSSSDKQEVFSEKNNSIIFVLGRCQWLTIQTSLCHGSPLLLWHLPQECHPWCSCADWASGRLWANKGWLEYMTFICPQNCKCISSTNHSPGEMRRTEERLAVHFDTKRGQTCTCTNLFTVEGDSTLWFFFFFFGQDLIVNRIKR